MKFLSGMVSMGALTWALSGHMTKAEVFWFTTGLNVLVHGLPPGKKEAKE